MMIIFKKPLSTNELILFFFFLKKFQIHPWRRPASLRVRPTFNSEYSGSHSGNSNKLSPAGIKEEDDVQLRRVHSFESDEK